VRRELPDAIHKLRVAFRRIRSALTTFGRIFSPDWARDLRSELRWAAGELSPLRDAEVMRETLLARVDRLGSKDREPVAGVVRYQLDKRIAAGTSRAWATLASSRYRRLLGSLETAATAPHLAAAATEPAEQALLPLAAKRWARLADDVAGLTLEAPATAWHTVRKDAKKVRYATEELASIPGMSLSAFAEQLEKVTELLGDHQDAHVARTTLRQIAGGESGAIGYSLGLLGAHQTALEHRARRGFLALWPAVADAQVSAGLITK
jgi:CHAD domain-containing protein